MAPKISYDQSMAHLWKNPKFGTFYAEWQETKTGTQGKRRTVTRRKALAMPGERKATKDPKLAKKLINQFNRTLMAGKVEAIATGVRMTWGDFKVEFLRYVEANRSDGTYKLYIQALNKASECWGDGMDVSHITGRHIDHLTSNLLLAGLSMAYVGKIFRHVKAALKKAIEWEYAKAFIFPKAPKVPGTVRYIPVHQLKEIMGEIKDPEFYDFCLLSAYLGLRSGEALRLTPDDIDAPEGFLRISALQKNRQESRVPINDTAREILVRCLGRMDASRKRRTLWRWTTVSYMSNLFKRAVRSAGYEDFHFHDLRHTFASYMAMQGEPLKTIQDLMRHKSITSTLVYAHLSPDHLIEASNRFSLGPIPTPKPDGQK
ncbi:tyrosine-type recombinase/integrase [Desulfoluna spongiiphila]|uniref:Phage integrase family protein n=1 Tax=Desulfoluna spongiiphila TaxID=419481 RepID=A0A1G5J9X7_9BACT|nr:site-specific integrase [Desulfoluna spongiiphila]SCY84498.1 Phage integrase family protein [Desulfoluna spongiiphila]